MRISYILAILCIAIYGCHLPNPEGTTFQEKYGDSLEHTYTQDQREKLEEVLCNEPLRKYDLIQWQTDPQEAIAMAQRQQKPILVFFFVNEFAKPDAEHC